MLIGRTLMCISFGGGSSDLGVYHTKYGDLVISTAINKDFDVIITTDESEEIHINRLYFPALHQYVKGFN